MIKKIQKIGNSKGIVLDKALLKLLQAENSETVELVPHEDGLLIKKKDTRNAYRYVSSKHRKSLDKLAE